MKIDNKIKRALKLCIFGAAVTVAGVRAGFAQSDVMPKRFVQIELYGRDNAYDNFEDILNDSVSDPFSPYIAGGGEIKGGMGIRAGLLFPTRQKGEHVGGSVGIVMGPSGRVSASDGLSPSLNNYSLESKTQFVRVMLEGRKQFDLSPKVAFRLGAGLGLARSKTTEVYREVLSGSGNHHEVFNTRSGFSYEIATSVLFSVWRNKIELGIAYDGFPEIRSFKDSILRPTEYRKSYRWNPISLRIGMEF
jgi:hypothetical protein